MAWYSDLLGTMRSTFKVARALFDASGLTASRSFTLPDQSGTIALVGSGAVSTKTSDYTLESSDQFVFVDASGGDVTITLPAVASSAGKYFTISKVDSSSNSVVLDGDGTEEISGSTTQSFDVQWTSITVVCDGSQWVII